MIDHIALRLYRRLFGVPGREAAPTDADQVLDGISAVALVEAALCDATTLSGAPSSSGAATAWRQAVARQPSNLWGRRLITHRAEGARGAMASAMGHGLAGLRTTLFLSGAELASVQDQLAGAAGRHLPLVIHLVGQALPAQGSTHGSGDRALQLACDSGAVVLHAENVQQAVDYALVARRLAEERLRPVVVAMDREGTARSLQEVRLPEAELIRSWLGSAEERIPCPDAAQELLFGPSRRRVPRWHDLDHPLLNGAGQGPGAFARGIAGNQPWFADGLLDRLRHLCRELGQRGGRRPPTLSRHRTDDARLLLLAHGSVLEQARAVADELRRSHRIRAGVVGIHSLHPFPADRLLEQLRGCRHLLVLERHDTPLAGDPPLLQRVRAALAMAAENRANEGSPPHPGLPAIGTGSAPRLHSALFGVAGLPLANGDLIAFCRSLEQGRAGPCWLGIDFHADSSRHPKRQVLLDQIRRACPEIQSLGLRAPDAAIDLRPPGAIALGLLHRPGHRAAGLPADCAGLLRGLVGGHLRGVADPAADSWDGWRLEQLLLSAEAALSPTGEQSLDLLLVAGDGPLQDHHLNRLRNGGGLLLCDLDDQAPDRFGKNNRVIEKIGKKALRLYHLPPPERLEESAPVPADGEWLDAYRLGGLIGVMLSSNLLTHSPSRVAAAWKRLLQGLPEHESQRLGEAFDSGMRRIGAASPPPADDTTGSWREQVPGAVRRLGGSDETLYSLPRFWDQLGILYREGEQDTLTADPYLTAGAVPPLSSTFRDLSPLRHSLPRFLPDRCSGCGDCWSACPDSAIGVTALTPAALVDCGIRLAGADGARQVAGKLAARISALGRQQEYRGTTAGELLQQAWQWLQQKAPLPEGRRESVEAAVGTLVQALEPLPLARTDLLFEAGERLQRDGGELLTLVIDPAACKGCGLCVAACGDEALEMPPQTDRRLARAQARWRIWEQLPDTPSATIERLMGEGSMHGLAALLLSRHCAMAMAGGDGAEPGDTGRLALRLALAAIEYRQQPLVSRFAGQLETLQRDLRERIRETLTSALPVDDLEALLRNLGRGGDDIDLAALARDSAGAAIDGRRLEAQVGLARELEQAHWRLTEGDYGLGRSRVGIALAPGAPADRVALFPNNPFHSPVTLDMSGNGAELAFGLLQGQLHETLATLDLARRARQALAGEDPSPPPAGWADLDEEERALCPPLLLVGSEQELGGRELAQISWLLGTGLPLKVLLLSELDLGLATPPRTGPSDGHTDPLLTALAQRSAYVAQCAVAEPGHYHHCLREALRFTGPALIRLYAPNPLRHGFPPHHGLEQSRLAVTGRALPLLRYHPQGEGVFGSRISLQGNPDPEQTWARDGTGEPLTPLHWMLTERRFAAHFQPLEEDDPPPRPALEWLDLSPDERRRSTPVITRADDPRVRLKVSPAALAGVERLGGVWRTLQELAGLVTPFTRRVREEAEREVAASHAAELAALKADYEARLQALQGQLEDEIAGRIRQRLLNLAGYE
ncbi:MAG TPA: pyruvate ferredoxin oxidoreductase [Sedimenticola thiotaurini]|uniref:Pyruvate ferredoxin oxidoreductase n=1 Tax=Sedimenticola thiotaurini TaxID=1543721 RepID=A0A831RLX5_9GAMM|nr:pyruvate ferredoxin oxidoreductase [Sedimenticola thiotaurini]